MGKNPFAAVGAAALLLAIAAWWLLRATADVPPAPAANAAPVADTPAAAPGAAATPIDTAPADASPSTARTQAIEGHVVRGTLLQHGAPLANVTLRVFAGADRKASAFAAATTAADGAFVFAMPQETFFFVVDAPTIPRDWWSGWQPSRASDWDLGTVHVPRGGTVTGVVRDDAGQPIAGAEVRAAYSQYDRIPAPAAPPEPPPVRTAADGRFSIAGLRPGGYGLTALAPNRAPGEANATVAESGTTNAELSMHGGTRLQGIVLDWRGQPLPGAEVAMSSMPNGVTTDARGWFVIEHFLAQKSLRVKAHDHIEDWQDVPWNTEEVRIRLGRAVTLRGIVHGAGSAKTTIRVTEAKDSAADAADARPWHLIDKPLPVAADGTFAIEGLSTSDFVVSAEAAGVGASPPLRVALRDDAAIELTIAPSHSLRVLVQDGDGRAIEGAEVVEDPNVADAPGSYSGPYAKDVSTRIFGSYRKRTTAATAGVAVLPIDPQAPLAFGVRCKGFLPEIRVFGAREVPAEVTVVLQRAGGVRGVVRGGWATEYARSVVLWSLADDDAMHTAAAPPAPGAQRSEWRPLSTTVDADGRFVFGGLRPGAWRAAVSRGSRAGVGKRPDEQVGAVPVLDDGADLRTVVDFTVAAGGEAAIEIGEPVLGTVRGRVLLRGSPCADVQVLAARPGEVVRRWLGQAEQPDWDNDLVRNFAAGQRTGADGTFAFRYREAGRVELRTRHDNGAATSPPTLVDLPPPGSGDVECTLVLAAGTIRGRFPIERLPEKERSLLKVVLYPMHKAQADPSYSNDWETALSWDCARIENPDNGRFAFDYLPDGDWLVRVQPFAMGSDPGPAWQRVVRVQGDVVDLGDMTPATRVATKLAWKWPAGAEPGKVRGIWLRVAHGNDAAAIWAGTFGAEKTGTACSIPPGKYTVVPFGSVDASPDWAGLDYGFGGITGNPLAEPFPFEVHTDGSVTPAEFPFVPIAK